MLPPPPAPPPGVEFKFVYPTPRPQLDCPDEPAVPTDLKTDADEHDRFVEPALVAAEECRRVLRGVKTWVDSWPKE